MWVYRAWKARLTLHTFEPANARRDASRRAGVTDQR
jgi:hypothetical protein